MSYASRCLEIFSAIKLIDGPLGLSSTLKRHKPLVAWLKQHLLDDLKSIESDLDLIQIS